MTYRLLGATSLATPVELHLPGAHMSHQAKTNIDKLIVPWEINGINFKCAIPEHKLRIDLNDDPSNQLHWAIRCLKSPATRLFAQQCVQTNKKEKK